jgi:hypothetical protein
MHFDPKARAGVAEPGGSPEQPAIQISFDFLPVTDAELEQFKRLTPLRGLEFKGTQVTGAGLRCANPTSGRSSSASISAMAFACSLSMDRLSLRQCDCSETAGRHPRQ